jgi:putative two-component system response regulator
MRSGVMKLVLAAEHDSKIQKTVMDALQNHYDVMSIPLETITLETAALEAMNTLQPDLILLAASSIVLHRTLLASIINAPELREIPVIVIVEKEDTESESISLELGASDYIRSPFTKELLLHRVKTCLELQSYRRDKSNAEKFQDAISMSFAELVEFRDTTTGGHLKNTTTYFNILLDEVVRRDEYRNMIPEEEVRDLLRSAPLHDIGKIGINDDILRKSSPLDYKEFEYMKTHTTLGKLAFEKIIRETGGTRWLSLARDIAYCHHERWDGTGYPNGLKGEEIPIYARILTIADVYDALTSRRTYKEAYSHQKAMDIIIDGKGSMFDPNLVDIFTQASKRFEQALINKKKNEDSL